MPASRTWPARSKVVLLGAVGAVALSTVGLPARAVTPAPADTPAPTTTDAAVPASVGDPAVRPLTISAASAAAAADLCASVAVTAGFTSTTAVTAVAVALAESSCDPSATGYNRDSHNSYDRGLWQLNNYWQPEVTDSCAYAAQCNANAAFKISSKGSDWRQWSTYSSGLYKKYLTTARTALSKVTTLAPAGPAMLYGASTSATLYSWSSTTSAFTLRSSRWANSSYSVSSTANRVAAGDFDGDGHTDVASAYQAADGSFRIYVWPSGGTTATLWYTSGPFSLAPVAGRMVAGDFDGNGRSDLAFLRANGTYGAAIWRFLSTGSRFAAGVKTWEVTRGYSLAQVGDRVVAGDLDGNGTADLAAAYQYPDGTFRIHVWKAAVTSTGSSGWYHSGTFSLSTVGSRMVAADFDGSGRDDVALVADAGSGGAAIWRFLSSGSALSATRTWQNTSGFSLANVAGRAAAGDANGDGKADLVLAYQNADATFRYHVWSAGATYAGGWYVSPSNFPLANVADRLVMGRW